MEYSDDVDIDESALDVESARQPMLTAKYSRLFTDAQNIYVRLKEELEFEKAQLDKAIREDPEKFGISKITESVVQNTIILQSSYQDLTKMLLDARYEMEQYRTAVNAIETKKNSIDGLIKLHGMNYFAGPSVPRDLSKERQNYQQEKIKKADAGVARALRRAKK